jgi:hypothetical protein
MSDNETNVDPEDAELAELASLGTANSKAIDKLRESDPLEAQRLELEQLREQNRRYGERQQRQSLQAYRAKLQEEFPLAPVEEISGATRQEMRAKASRMHAAVEKIVAKAVEGAGIKPGEKPNDGQNKLPINAAERTNAERAKDWGPPPPSSAETLSTGPSVPSWDEVRAAAISGRADRSAVLEELKRNGVKPLPAESFASRLRAQPAKT